MNEVTDKLGASYAVSIYERNGALRILAYSGSRIVARSRYEPKAQMIVSLWVDPNFRRRGIAYAIVKLLWAQHPESVGRYPQQSMSRAMHGFLEALMCSEGLDHCTPSEKLRGR